VYKLGVFPDLVLSINSVVFWALPYSVVFWALSSLIPNILLFSPKCFVVQQHLSHPILIEISILMAIVKHMNNYQGKDNVETYYYLRSFLLVAD
jgi:hypothetical protein